MVPAPRVAEDAALPSALQSVRTSVLLDGQDLPHPRHCVAEGHDRHLTEVTGSARGRGPSPGRRPGRSPPAPDRPQWDRSIAAAGASVRPRPSEGRDRDAYSRGVADHAFGASGAAELERGLDSPFWRGLGPGR